MTITYPPIGLLLRDWRAARRMSQLDLALDCGISARHLGFIEVGRAKASREAVGRLADSLRVSLRERNALLLAAGFAPQHPESDLASPALERMRDAVALILEHQNPYPAFVLNRNFDILDMNPSAVRIGGLISGGKPPKHDNLLRQVFDPEDLRPVIANWPDVAAWFLRRLRDEMTATAGNQTARDLFEEILAYPGVPAEWRRPMIGSDVHPVLTIDFLSPMGTLSFFETITTFAAPLTPSLDELRIDCTYPANDHTAAICRQLAEAD
ncbi:hypothetical protein ABAC460_21255 [Asticcacaulis sp. AC460]|uniref:helix-turn-helix domain-containing protein n=1 Tax=Asticcacaulis sp. AC460 TaxID=1282360 RepID=UPI0003C3B397|nr:helix-turn-helix transcriptional regulator [Asticcacaulis sp. AC460]ESQ87100.1 hypothetical protein ABAC460_21255 [Asticcacaulis sp. AC460]